MTSPITISLDSDSINNQSGLNITPDPFATVQSEDFRPRYLTSTEIRSIVEAVPKSNTMSEMVADVLRNYIMGVLHIQISRNKITPLAIDDMKEDIKRRYFIALVKNGKMVGIIAAQSIGQLLTQMTLNSFHQAGALKVTTTTGVKRARELLDASKNIKTPSCMIRFKNRHLDMTEVLIDMRPKIVGVTISMIVKDEIVDTSEGLLEDGDPWWYSLYEQVVGPIRKNTWMMRLILNVENLIKYKITMEDVSRSIQDQIPPSVQCVYSPIGIGIVDIFPSEKDVQGKVTSGSSINAINASMIFLKKSVLPNLDKVQIKGISGITELFPSETPVWQIVGVETSVNIESVGGSLQPGNAKLTGDTSPGLHTGVATNRGNFWILRIDLNKMDETGISIENLVYLLKTAGLKVLPLSEYDDSLPVEEYVLVETTMSGKPSKIIAGLIDVIRDKNRERQKQIREKRIQMFGKSDQIRVQTIKEIKLLENEIAEAEKADIIKASKFVQAETTGSNLQQLLINDYIDPRYTYSNHIHEVHANLGIEAARNLIVRELLKVITSEGSYVNRRHLGLLSSYMTYLGRIINTAYSGMSSQRSDPLATASYQRTLQEMSEASATGKKISKIGISTSVLLGRKFDQSSKAPITPVDDAIVDSIIEQTASGQLNQVNPQDVTDFINNMNIDDFSLELDTELSTNDLTSLIQPTNPLVVEATTSDPNVELRQERKKIQDRLHKLKNLRSSMLMPGVFSEIKDLEQELKRINKILNPKPTVIPEEPNPFTNVDLTKLVQTKNSPTVGNAFIEVAKSIKTAPCINPQSKILSVQPIDLNTLPTTSSDIPTIEIRANENPAPFLTSLIEEGSNIQIP